MSAENGNGRRREAGSIRYCLTLLADHVTALHTKASHATRRLLHPPGKPTYRRGENYPLCGDRLGAPEQRPPRDELDHGGEVRRLMPEVLVWRRCAGCGKHQVGEPPARPERAFA